MIFIILTMNITITKQNPNNPLGQMDYIAIHLLNLKIY